MPEKCSICQTELLGDEYCPKCKRRVLDEILESQVAVLQSALGGWRDRCAQLKAEIEKLKTIGGEHVVEIIASWLRAHGFDGLVADMEECGCSVDDLAPCGGPFGSCRPGYKGPDPSGECDSLIYSTREAAKAAKDKP